MKIFILVILSVVVTLFLVSCMTGSDTESQKIEDLIQVLRVSDTIDSNTYRNYFIDDTNMTRYQFQTNILNQIKQHVDSSNQIHVYSYKLAKEKELKGLLDIEEYENVYIIEINKETSDKLFYFLMRENKVKSLCPMKKGNVIIGWL